MLDEGHLIDNKGFKVSFKNCIIIFTSNIGASKLNEISDYKERLKATNLELLKYFKPEFINRLDEIVNFNAINEEMAKDILEILLNKTQQKLKELTLKLEFSDAAKNELLKIGFSKEYGARALKRTIYQEIECKLSEYILKGDYKDKAFVDFKDNEFIFTF